VGGYLGARDLRAAGLTGTLPSLYAAQADGCAPVVSAWEDGRNAPAEWETPDTICGGVEVPDPAGGRCVLKALRETDGGAVASEDPDILESAVSVASHEGPEVGATGGVAAAGAWTLADRGDLGEDDVVVLVNPAAGGKEDDVLRSHLMGQGV
jgi:threonine synthase